MKINVKNGIDRINESVFSKELAGKKVGLITNVTGMTKDLVSSVTVLDELCDLQILFAPEHGIRGEAQAGEKVDSYFDPYFSKKVISLYGEKRAPEIAEISDLDILVYDIQDIGSRYYTYIYTMVLSMKVAAKAGIKFWILDRLDILGGQQVQGAVMPEKYYSFVGMLPIPNVYGMTVGELATFCNKELNINAMLTVVEVAGWQRGISIDETDLPWIMPSPNIPTPLSALVYTGTCLFEGTNLSEGRGTTRPFEMIGAPWINADLLTETLNKKKIVGIKFRPVFFTPTFSKYAGDPCEGVQIHITSPAGNPLQATYVLLETIEELFPDKLKMDLSFENSVYTFFEHLAGGSFGEVKNEHNDNEFIQKRNQYLLYE